MSFDNEMPLSQHDLLNREDCAEICARVLALRNRWTERSPGRFYTLGAAAYLDATDARDAYLAAARETNPILQENFDAVLELVREFFEELLGDAAFYSPHLALPGFHVFTSQHADPGTEDIAPRAHFDMQWMHAIADHEPQATLSFTLPIERPRGGACLAVWPVRYADAVRFGYAACDYAARHPWQRVVYERGRIVIHDGHVLHAIGPASDPAPRGYRITLQGHGVRMPTGWMLYW
jgi:hypothetical protein